jgi:hypothetical protein
MFERYTEKARRTIFFSRYEASQFGSPSIETEHILLGLLREDKVLAERFLRLPAALELIRRQVEGHRVAGEKVPTTVDLPLSGGSVRVLTYAAEEASRLKHEHIGTIHLLLGLVREKTCFAAELLRGHGVTLESVVEYVQEQEPATGQEGASLSVRLELWLAEQEAAGGIWTERRRRAANSTTGFAIYAGDSPRESAQGQNLTPAQRVAQIQKQIDFIVERRERAIFHQEFERVHILEEEERKERENLRLACEEFVVEESRRVPLMCVEIIGDERFSAVVERCDGQIADGVSQIWLLEPVGKRAYTFTKGEGLRECRDGVLRMAELRVEMELGRIFE